MKEIPGVVRYAKGATDAQYDEAKAILEVLDLCYPNHPWSVEISGDETGGRVFIRHLGFTGGNWGMNIRHTKNDSTFYSSSAFKREVIMRAGEWLERVGLTRGAYDPDAPMSNKADGVKLRKGPAMDVVVAPGEVRDTPHRPITKEEEHGEVAGVK